LKFAANYPVYLENKPQSTQMSSARVKCVFRAGDHQV
jgi:hypothetical protein